MKIALPGIVPTSIQLSIMKSTSWPITIDVLHEMRCIEFLRAFFLEFQISESEFRFLNFSKAEFKKKSDQNLWNWKWKRNSAYDGGPRNQNWKPEFPTKYWAYVVITKLHAYGA